RIEGIEKTAFADSRGVIRVLHQMAEAGLVESGIQMTAYVRPKGRNNAKKLLDRICALDRALLDILREEHPMETVGEWVDLNLRTLNQRLLDAEFPEANPETVRGLLVSLSRDGKGFAGRCGSIDLRHAYQDHFRVRLRRDWKTIADIADKRRNLAWILLNAIYDRIPKEAQGQAEILVSFSSDDLAEAIGKDLTLQVKPDKMLNAIDRGLLFLHEQKVIILQKGLSVFRQAMTVRILPEAKGRRYSKGDYAPLSHHYGQRTFQVHVMNEYARQGLRKISQALSMVAAYFTMDTTSFIHRFFGDRADVLQRATGEESFKKIVESLRNPFQESIVAGDAEKNRLILAGPGSGKTRTVVHRCAYLLRVRRVPARSVLVLVFNHGAALSVRRRLRNLVGNDAAGVTVLTYHGLAMRLTGTSFAARADAAVRDEATLTEKFDAIIQDAVALLEGEKSVPGLAPDEIRDRLLSGYRHILVDEYQDIDADQYRLISAVAGRTLNDPDGRLSILAVGDDDQSIYGFRGANVEFIRRFQADYEAEAHYLVENYRSTAHIIAAANQLIQHNRDRVKTDHPIRIDRRRKADPPGGQWKSLDPLGEGRVQRITAANPCDQAAILAAELERFRKIDSDFDWTDVAVLSRRGFQYPELCAVRGALEDASIPYSRPLDRGNGFPLHRVREIAEILDVLLKMKADLTTAEGLLELHTATIQMRPGGMDTVWDAEVRRLLSAWKAETGNAELPVRSAADFIYESLAEQKREQRLGRGVFLGTAHGAKGLEFSHVFILDGGWPAPSDTASMEEERRLYYVAMTRAMETLTVFRRTDCGNPHVNLLNGPHVRDRRGNRKAEPGNDHLPKYEILGLSQVYLDFAGCCPENGPVHRALSEVNAGDSLSLREEGGKIVLAPESG
ncbi:MAG: ATP-dependent helicase, partial [Thermodesulfobacteriota bacterium]